MATAKDYLIPGRAQALFYLFSIFFGTVGAKNVSPESGPSVCGLTRRLSLHLHLVKPLIGSCLCLNIGRKSLDLHAKAETYHFQ